MATLGSAFTSEETNHLRLVHLCNTIAPEAVRDFFDGLHPNLSSDLTKYKATLHHLVGIRPFQRDKLFPRGQPASVSTDFDLTLLICLLRNINPKVNPPPLGFDQKPHPQHKGDGANIARIKHYKHFLAHATDGKIPDRKFNTIWTELEDAINGLTNNKFMNKIKEAKSMMLSGQVKYSEETISKLQNEHESTIQQLQTKIAQLENSQEFITLGFETIDHFEDIMHQGSYKCFWGRVYLIGNFNVGKTTLAKILVGDPVPDDRQSTEGIWLYIGRAGIDLEGKKWIFLHKGSATRTILTTMLMSLQSRRSIDADSKGTISDDSNNTLLTTGFADNSSVASNLDVVNRSSVSQDETTASASGHIPYFETSNAPREDVLMKESLEAMTNDQLLDLLKDALTEGQYKVKIVPIDIWDFGGQKDYYMTHQLFITSRGIFVLMFNGSLDIHQHMPDLSFLPGHYGKPTIAVYLKHWVNSVLTFCRKMKKNFPRIAFVATHKDKIPKDEIEQHRKNLIESIDTLFKSHVRRGHLEYHSLIFIDARDEKDPEIATLKQLLIERAIDHPQWGEKMPSAWVPLELELAQEVEKGKNIISKSYLESLNLQNSSFKLTDGHLISFLKIQHSLGKLIYYDVGKMKDYVVLNPKFMIDVLRSIVTDEQFWPRGDKFTKAHQILRECGIVKKSTIFEMWELDEFSHISLYKNYMLDILSHLDVIVAPSTLLQDHRVDYYLVPCMITSPDNTNYMTTYCTTDSSIVLAYSFIDDVLPPALSYRFIGSILAMWDLKIYGGQKMIYSNLAVVEIKSQYDLAVQVHEKKIIVSLIHTLGKFKIDPTLASAIQECLTATVSRIAEFYCSLSDDVNTQTTTSFTIEYGVQCKSSLCVFHQSKMPTMMNSKWICPHHNVSHDVRCLRFWYAEKKAAKQCEDSCGGLGQLEQEQSPTEKHIRRLVTAIDFNSCRELAIHLGLEYRVWQDLEIQFQHDNIDNIKFMAVWKWRQKNTKAKCRDLIDALKSSGWHMHVLCQAFRDIEIDQDIANENLSTVPSFQTLETISNYIGNSSLQLGIELGFDVPQLENIQHEFQHKPLQQTREILKRWRNESNSNFTGLIKALQRIEKASCLNDIVF